MTSQKISQMTPATLPLTGNELVPIAVPVGGGVYVNRETPVSNIGGGAAAISIGKSMSSAYTASIANPVSGTSWQLQRMMRPLSPFAPQMQTFQDDCVQDAGFYTRNGNIGTWSFTNGQLNVASTANTFGNGQSWYSAESFEFPSFCVSLEGITPTPDTGANVIAVGIYRGLQNNLAAVNNQYYSYFEIGSGTQNRITIAKVINGTFSIIAQTAVSSLPSGISAIATEVNGNGFYCWIQVNNKSWIPVLSTSFSEYNMLSPTELANWHPFFQATGGTSTPWKISTIRTGYSNGPQSYRDFKVVSNKDGTPYVSNGFMYFTASNTFCSIWRMNVKNGKFEKVGQLLFNRGGTIFADLNAHIVWDKAINSWRVFWASWAAGLNNGVQIYAGTYNGDILNGVHTVTGSLVNVTQRTNNAVYDECLVWDSANSRWLLSYIVSPGGSFGGNFYPVVDTSTDLVNWTNLWAASGTTGYEGSCIVEIGGNFYVTAGNGSNFRCWNMSGTNLGTFTVDVFPPTAGNPPPHFIVFPWMDGDTTQYYALSFSNVQFSVNGTGVGIFGTGTPMLYKATQTETGFELPAIGVL
jgi:hypothetical protein